MARWRMTVDNLPCLIAIGSTRAQSSLSESHWQIMDDLERLDHPSPINASEALSVVARLDRDDRTPCTRNALRPPRIGFCRADNVENHKLGVETPHRG